MPTLATITVVHPMSDNSVHYAVVEGARFDPAFNAPLQITPEALAQLQADPCLLVEVAGE